MSTRPNGRSSRLDGVCFFLEKPTQSSFLSRQGYESLTRSSTNPDSDEEAVNDIAEVLDGDFSADYVPKIPKESGEEGKKDPNDDIERETNEVRNFLSWVVWKL